MAEVITLPLTLTAPPSSYSPPSSSSSLSPTAALPLYPAGPSYLSSARRQLLQRSFAEDDAALLAERERAAAEASAAEGEELYPGLGEEKESAETLAYDPKEWKKQDHYAVLGLGRLRYLATDDHIKVARESVVHHRRVDYEGSTKRRMGPQRFGSRVSGRATARLEPKDRTLRGVDVAFAHFCKEADI